MTDFCRHSLDSLRWLPAGMPALRSSDALRFCREGSSAKVCQAPENGDTGFETRGNSRLNWMPVFTGMTAGGIFRVSLSATLRELGTRLAL